MIDQSIFILVGEKELGSVICQLDKLMTFVKSPDMIDKEFNSHLWLGYNGQEFYFSLYAKEIDKGKVLLDFDCIDRHFVGVLLENPKDVLEFFMNSIVKSNSAYWIVNPPDLSLDKIYKKLVEKDVSIETVFCVEEGFDL